MVPLELAPPEAQPIPLTVTHVLEHLFCPRFTYFEYVLLVPEHQGRRGLVQRGRDAHVERRRTNPSYLRRKIGVTERRFDVPLASQALGVRGSVDEVLTLADGTMAPLDYKFAEAPKKVFENQKVQAALYGLLIAEAFGVPVTRAYLCYTRSSHRLVELPLGEREYGRARSALAEVLEVIRGGYFPPATPWQARCRDCCYRNICIR